MTTTSLDHLLPAPDEVLRCAEHARRIEVDPGGTAIRADRVVLVATPPPWPKPALDHPTLRPLAQVLERAVVPTRVLAHLAHDTGLTPDGTGPASGRPDPAPAGSGGGPAGTVMVVFERDGASAVERRYRAGSPEEALALARAVAAGDLDTARSWLEAEHVPARPAVLICTQGSHDVCCGSEGTRLASELEARADATRAANGGADPFGVFRVSHTGGHRFAPTAMTLPDGRMWAGLTTALVDQIVTRSGDVAELVPRCRGWWGADGGMAQVAERAVFAQRGWDLDRHDRQVEVTPLPGTGTGAIARATVTVTPLAPAAAPGPGGSAAAAERWEVDLAEGRAVPSIACRQAGGLPAKPGREYDVVSTRPIHG